MLNSLIVPDAHLCVPDILVSSEPVGLEFLSSEPESIEDLQMGQAMDVESEEPQFALTSSGPQRLLVGSYRGYGVGEGKRRHLLGIQEGPAVVLHESTTQLLDARGQVISTTMNDSRPDATDISMIFSQRGMQSSHVHLQERPRQAFDLLQPAGMLLRSAVTHDRLFRPLRQSDLRIQTITRTQQDTPSFMVVMNKTRVNARMAAHQNPMSYLSVFLYVGGRWLEADPSKFHVTRSDGCPYAHGSHILMSEQYNLMMYINLDQRFVGKDDFGKVVFAHPINETGRLFYQDPEEQPFSYLAREHVAVTRVADSMWGVYRSEEAAQFPG